MTARALARRRVMARPAARPGVTRRTPSARTSPRSRSTSWIVFSFGAVRVRRKRRPCESCPTRMGAPVAQANSAAVTVCGRTTATSGVSARSVAACASRSARLALVTVSSRSQTSDSANSSATRSSTIRVMRARGNATRIARSVGVARTRSPMYPVPRMTTEPGVGSPPGSCPAGAGSVTRIAAASAMLVRIRAPWNSFFVRDSAQRIQTFTSRPPARTWRTRDRRRRSSANDTSPAADADDPRLPRVRAIG